MARIEWKQVDSPLGSFSGLPDTALKALTGGALFTGGGLQTIADAIERKNTADAYRLLAEGHDSKDLESVNRSIGQVLQAHPSLSPETINKINTVYRAQQNAQLNAENLLLNKIAASPYQNEVNRAAANNDVRGTTRANDILAQVAGIDGGPMRSDAITFGNVGPIKLTNAQLAESAARTQATRAKMWREQEEQYATDYVNGGADWVLARIDPALLADPAGQKVLWDLIDTFDKQVPDDARGKTPGSKYAIYERVNALGSTLAGKGINTSLGSKGNEPFSYRTYNTLTGDYDTNSYAIDPSQSYIAQRIAESQLQAEEQAVQREAAIRQLEEEQARVERERLIRDANYRTLSKEVSTKGGQALNSQENKELLKTLSPEQQQLITLEIQQQAKQALINRQRAKIEEENVLLDTLNIITPNGSLNPYALMARGSTLPQELRELQKQEEELERQIIANQDTQVANQAVEDAARVVAARGFDEEAQRALAIATAAQNRQAVNEQSATIRALGDRFDADGREVGVPNRTYEIMAAMDLKEGWDNAYFRDRNNLKKPDGTPFTDVDLVKTSNTEVANAIVRMFTTPDGERQVSDDEVNKVFINAGKYIRDYEDAFIQSGRFRGKPEDIRLASIYLTLGDILAGMERNTGLVGYFGDAFDYKQRKSDKAHEDFLRALRGEDEIVNTLIDRARRLNVSQESIDQAVFNTSAYADKLDKLSKKIANEGGNPTDTEAKLMWQYAKEKATQENIILNRLNDPLYRGSPTQGR